MNVKELQAMQKWHRGVDSGEELHCLSCYDAYGEPVPYPCEVVLLLEEIENLKSSGLKTEVDCGHMDDERYGEIVFNGIVYKLVPTDQGRGPRSRKKSECSHVLASKQPKLFETGEFIIDIMVANCWCPKCGIKL